MPDDKIPGLSAVSEIRGFFETFMPGLFVLLHVGLLVYCVSPSGKIGKFLETFPDKGIAMISVIGLPVGYVIGLGLRLGRTNLADEISGIMVRATQGGREVYRKARSWWTKSNNQDESFAPKSRDLECLHRERFPYPCTVYARVAMSLPSQALDFYRDEWLKQASSNTEEDCDGLFGILRFGFFKELVSTADKGASKNLFAAEMMVRHAVHVCYALFICSVLLGISAILSGPGINAQRVTLSLLAGGEFVFLIVGFLPNLRLLRLSEVEELFTYCFLNRKKLKHFIELGE